MTKQSEWLQGFLAAEDMVAKDGYLATRVYKIRELLIDCEQQFYKGFSDYLDNYKFRMED